MDTHMTEYAELIRFAAEKRLWQTGDTIVVAVSGGPDSMALLHMLAAISQHEQISLIAAHINHGFRPEESRLEQEATKRFAQLLGIPFEAVSLNLSPYIEENRLNLQATARSKRYEFFHKIAQKYQACSIALAHHIDDQAETVLMHFLRGTGLAGLTGMLAKRNDNSVSLIRPLLRMNKTDIVDYCNRHKLDYFMDSSNLKKDYLRNQLRLDVLPMLQQYNPKLSAALGRTAEVVQEEDDYMEQQSRSLFASLVTKNKNECFMQCCDLFELHVALQRRLIKLILSYLSKKSDSFSFERIEAVRWLASPEAPSTGRTDAGLHIQAVREYGRIRWSIADEDNSGEDTFATIAKPATSITVDAGRWRFEFVTEHNATACKPNSRKEACFDATQIAFPLLLRTRRPGDRMQVLGLNGSKKVQDMFVDAKIAPSERDRYPLIFDAKGHLLWIPGIRRSAVGITGPDTKELLFIRADTNEDDSIVSLHNES